MKMNLVLGLLLLLGALASPEARAQTMTINVGAAVGSGLEIGAPGVTALHHSPFFVTVNAGVLLDNDLRFELGGALLMEVDGRVGIAVEPQLRIHTGRRRVRGYLLIGVPIFVAPYTLYGASLGPGVTVQLNRSLCFAAELLLRAYPFGNDLPDGGALFHADLTAGVRYAF